MSNLIVVIMAGGLGKRMNSDIPKVLHKIGNKPMLVRVIESSISTNPKKILIVVGKYKELIKNEIRKYVSLDNIDFIDQKLNGDINVTSPTGLKTLFDLSGVNLARIFWNELKA